MKSLKFRSDGTFTIVQFTDMHYSDGLSEEGREKDRRTSDLVARIIDLEKPDLIVLSGDMIWSHGVPDPAVSFRRAVANVAESGIPWAAVFGNHDAEGEITKEKLLRIQQESALCLTEAGPEGIGGLGNYVLVIRDAADAREAAVLYFLDSGEMAPEAVGGYAWIRQAQVNWYAEQSRLIAERNGGPLPALAFFHIPLPEYEEVWTKGTVAGQKFERVECARINTGLFGAIVERGDVMGTFVGHDHDNDYCGTMHGVRLCYGRVTGYNTYGRLPRGARVIRLREGERAFDTWIRQEDGELIR